MIYDFSRRRHKSMIKWFVILSAAKNPILYRQQSYAGFFAALRMTRKGRAHNPSCVLCALLWQTGSSLFPFQFRPERAEVFDKARVGALDDLGVAHDAAAGDGRGDHGEGDGGADDVGRVDHGGAERLVAEDDD